MELADYVFLFLFYSVYLQKKQCVVLQDLAKIDRYVLQEQCDLVFFDTGMHWI